MSSSASSRLALVVVPDITAPGAYGCAMSGGVTHVIHVASPLVTGTAGPDAEYFVRPAERGTLELLEAAQRSGTVRRVVITSSIAALVPVAEMEGRPRPARSGSRPRRRRTPVGPGHRPAPPESLDTEFAAYAASKIAALRAAEAWVAAERPAFDVVHLHPGFVLGRNEAATTPAAALRGTNAILLAMLLGRSLGPFAGHTVHVDDVASAHVLALDPAVVPGGQSYILGRSATWNDAKDIVRQRFPDALAARVLVSTGRVDTVKIRADSNLTETTFAIRLKGFEEQVCSVVGHFLELRERSRAGTRPATRSAVNQTVRATA